MTAEIADAVRDRVEAAMASPEVAVRIQQRLKEERAALEEKVTQQLEAEKRALLARKRAQQEERRRKAEDLERILQENQRKVEEAQKKAALALEREGRKEGGQPKWQNQGLRIVEDP